MSESRLLEAMSDYATAFLPSLAERRIGPTASHDELIAALGGPLPAAGADDLEVIAALIRDGESGINAMPSGRFFGFVLGGSHPAALAADWLTSVWDQNAVLYAPAPTAAVVEEVAAEWLRDLLGLPAGVSSAFVTGCQLAHVTCLAAARHHVLAQAGWDVNEAGMAGSPELRVLVGDEVHVTVPRALRLLGLGSRSLVSVPSDGQGRMRADHLLDALGASTAPTIVCVQVGNVNTGASDPVDEIVDGAHEAGAWVHVDGAFGLWAAAAASRRHLVKGVGRADSWATDGHKWLNVPYDCGYAFCAHPDDHRAAMTASASYLIQSSDRDAPRDPFDWNPESSRRARGFPTYAALKALGREGVSELVERCCDHARLFAALLGAAPDIEVLNDVVLNQVLVRFGDDDVMTRETVRRVQEDGTCWLSGTTWHGVAAMRISVSNWRTTREDVERSVEAILRCARGAIPTG